jgi:hypothetical protein
MYAPLHCHNRNAIDFSDHQPARVALRCRTHESRYVFIRDSGSLIKIVGETTETTA